MLMKNCIILSILLSLVAMSCLAIPAKRIKRSLTLADGTTVMATLVGDENGHWYVDDKGNALTEDSIGIAHYISQFEFESRNKAKTERMTMRNNSRKARLAKAKQMSSFITRGSGETIYEGYTGHKKGLIILVNFTNKKFTFTRDDFNALANEKGYSQNGAQGSVSDYFREQSYGKFELEFNVVGPYNLAHDMKYYGKNDDNDDDILPGEMITEAVKLADKDVNFADYDWDRDGEVDQVYVIYAGYSEEQGGPAYAIYSHEWDLASAKHYKNGGNGPVLLDNVWINTYACSSELKDYKGKKMNGIGTMCHEFSHCLGLPDLYDTDNGNNFGMRTWSIMDYGSYNGDGHRPCGYTSYERWVAGWLEPVELSVNTDITDMKPITQEPEAYVIYNDANHDEYYLLENRQLTSWDDANEGHGLLILHVDYDKEAWADNTVNNNPSHQRLTVIHADNDALNTSCAGDPYPGTTGNNSFTDNSIPSAKLYNANKDGKLFMGKPITDISENIDGTISFKFSNPKNPTGITQYQAHTTQKIYSIHGQYMGTDLKKLPQGVYKVKSVK